MNLLLNFYTQSDAGDSLNEAQAKIWLHVLGHLPNDVLQAAVLQWAAENRPFPPKIPGEVLALANPVFTARLCRLRLVDHMLRAAPEPAIDADPAEGLRVLREALAILRKPKRPLLDPVKEARHAANIAALSEEVAP
ncbi:MAG TPA: hypothetical protein VG735_07950 [Caulobacterales bacterium]|nr:hypothetical protein [Caulobacterales bacterium]